MASVALRLSGLTTIELKLIPVYRYKLCRFAPQSLIFINCHRFSTPSPKCHTSESFLTYSSFENRLFKESVWLIMFPSFLLFIMQLSIFIHMEIPWDIPWGITWHSLHILHILHFQFLRASQSGFSFLQ